MRLFIQTILPLVFITSCSQSLIQFPAQPDAGCPTGLSRCADTCVSLTTSPQHCGDCSRVCSTGETCRDGHCESSSTCVPGARCAPRANSCHLGSAVCDGGALSDCIDDAIAVPNGTACLDGGVCVAGQCEVCMPNQTCDVANPCHVGRTECANGVSSCVDSTVSKPNGTSCGTNLICASGACVSCEHDARCALSASACVEGKMNCLSATGPACEATTTPLDAGTVCGTDTVCSGQGTCVSCIQDAGCSLGTNSCAVGAIACASGALVCTAVANKPVGASCGTDAVCDPQGSCVICAEDAGCSLGPTSCFVGAIACATGAPVCVGVATKPVGTACTATDGGAGVCDSTQSCNACVAGAACQGNPGEPCKHGVVQCSSGTPVCVDGAAVNDGTSCNTDLVCLSGTCQPCSVDSHCGAGRGCYGGRCADVLKTCKELRAQMPTLDSGVYTIDPDLNGSAVTALSVYCDMATADGGWTLISNYAPPPITANQPTTDCASLSAYCNVTNINWAAFGYTELLQRWSDCPTALCRTTRTVFEADTGACFNSSDSLTVALGGSALTSGLKIWNDCAGNVGGQTRFYAPFTAGGNTLWCSSHFIVDTTGLATDFGTSGIVNYTCPTGRSLLFVR